VTTSGRVISGAWSTVWERVWAFMRSAMNFWVAGLIMRSSSAMRYLRVWGIAVEDVGDGFAFVGSQRRDIDQGLNARVTGRADNAAGVGVAGQHDGSFGSVDGSFDRVDVVVERGQRDGCGGDGDPGLVQISDDSAPA
jgi:hypothetical protein